MPCKFTQTGSFPKDGEHLIVPRIRLLFINVCPFAVLFIVALVVINSLKAASFWSWSHISIECLERFQPSPANCYSTTAPIGIPVVGRVVTSLFHIVPRFILNRISHPVLDFCTSARSRIFSQSGSSYLDKPVTFTDAQTEPMDLTTRENARGCFCENCKLAEYLTYGALFFKHDSVPFQHCFVSNGVLATTSTSLRNILDYGNSRKLIRI